MEEWREILDFEKYAISSEGRVKNIKAERLLALTINHQNITKVNLMRDHVIHTRSVAVLVANAFLPPPREPSDTPIHRDGDRTNVAARNLMWRPRWYAIMYHKQFVRPRLHHIDKPIRNVTTGEEFNDSLDAAMYHGVLEHDIVRSVALAQPIVPLLGHEFEMV